MSRVAAMYDRTVSFARFLPMSNRSYALMSRSVTRAIGFSPATSGASLGAKASCPFSSAGAALTGFVFPLAPPNARFSMQTAYVDPTSPVGFRLTWNLEPRTENP
jgi:hypothetical protein